MADFVEELERLEEAEIEAVEVETLAETVKRVIKPKEVTRSNEELFSFIDNNAKNIKTMTDREKTNFIEFLMNHCTYLSQKMADLDNNTRGAYDQIRQLTLSVDSIKLDASTRLNFVRQQIKTCYEAVNLLSNTKEIK